MYWVSGKILLHKSYVTMDFVKRSLYLGRRLWDHFKVRSFLCSNNYWYLGEWTLSCLGNWEAEGHDNNYSWQCWEMTPRIISRNAEERITSRNAEASFRDSEMGSTCWWSGVWLRRWGLASDLYPKAKDPWQTSLVKKSLLLTWMDLEMITVSAVKLGRKEEKLKGEGRCI